MTGTAAAKVIDLKKLADQLNRPIKTMRVLKRDPFDVLPADRALAQWAAELWQRFDMQPGAHIRRLHYRLVSQPKPIKKPDGSPYLNIAPDAAVLNVAMQAARYLQLVDADDLVDRRNAEPVIFRNEDETESDPDICSYRGVVLRAGVGERLIRLALPSLRVEPPQIAQPYVVEVWAEKSTMDDILRPLCERYDANLVQGVGETSVTRCLQLVDRAARVDRPVRILYVSDFDPGGISMPTATARKIEFFLYQRQCSDLDIQVRPIFLTHDQCVEYRLPRIPLKKSERRAATFEARYGEGGTELDALEALRPGEMERVLEEEILRYYDTDLRQNIRAVANDVQTDIGQIHNEVHGRHAQAIADLETEQAAVLERIEAEIAAFKEKAAPVLEAIENDLDDEAPSVDDYEWPQGAEVDDDPDPLFDSTRDFIEQINRYKRHQGKRIDRAPRTFSYRHHLICGQCKKQFEARKSDTKFCGARCRNRFWQSQNSKPSRSAATVKRVATRKGRKR